jgi:hypothetical protein
MGIDAMTVADALKRIREVHIRAGAPEVFETAARAIACRSGATVITRARQDARRSPGVVQLLDPAPPTRAGAAPARIVVRLRENGSGVVAASDSGHLFAAVSHLLDVLADRDLKEVAEGLTLSPAFSWNRPCYDLFLTQEGRIQHGLNRETYVRRLAECGFTHVEVNGLASPMGLETGPKGEVYPMFYTYCPALDQFVSSSLNKGLYPFYYLSANLAYLKENAALARKYGLVPGLLSFEPRTVPEEFFARYPMLRGARVDHPFRSFKPRYTMTVTHPLVREHYAEMVTKLLREVPELGYLAVWTNDSGSGFEHTKALYVGRNGGPYMIREWKDDKEIARVAGEWALTFFRGLRDAARKVNPGFRVIARLESFYGEHDTIWRGLGDGVEVETTSLVARGWDMPYTHPKYPDSKQINGGSVYQLQFAKGEKTLMADLEGRASQAHFYFAAGPHQMFAPLIGVPYPRLTYRRLKLLWRNGVRRLSQIGGTCPPELVPWNVNHEVLRRFQMDPATKMDDQVAALARRWAGEQLAPALLRAWTEAEQAMLAFPNISTLYSTIGFTWYRLWARPLVPNIEAIPREERAYYEEFMCTTPHNPNNVDLSRDVLFRLTTAEKSRVDVERIDEGVWPPLDEAIDLLASVAGKAEKTLGVANVIADQLVRLSALRCWFMTQRNVAAWVAGVYGWMEASSKADKRRHRAMLADMMEKEIANSEALVRLVDSGVEFMATTDKGETPLMHGRNLKELLRKRIALMTRHMDDEPFIDNDYTMRIAGRTLE